MSRTRREQIRDEKGPYVEYFTVKEAAKTAGVSVQRWERWVRAGKIQTHAVRTDKGWRLWTPTVVREVVDRRQRGEL